jgi:prepilin-type N-terminal cleavage/methylation domain-containing protein
MTPRRSARRQAGFTLMEVLVAIVIFAISIVGLVAMEARSAEAQRASSLLRDGERIAQEVMADLQAQGFTQLLTYDFEGNPPPALPYDDTAIPAASRMRDFRRPPVDQPDATNVPGSIRGSFLVVRRVDWVVSAVTPPSANPPVLPTDLPLVNALLLDVTVMWIDDSNPTMPPPADLLVADLTPAMIDPTSVDFLPYVGAVQLRTVRANDAVVVVPPVVPPP